MNNYITFPKSESMSLTRQVHEKMNSLAIRLGMQDYEIGEYEGVISDAFDTLDTKTLRKNPKIVDWVMKKIEILSDARNYAYAPFEMVLDSFSNEPEYFVGVVTNPSLSSREILETLGIC